MADPLPWPSVLMPSSEDWSLRGGTRSGGQTFQGNEQIIASPTARWKATLNIPCWEPEHIREMRRVIALGRSFSWYVGPYERDRAPWVMEPIIGGLVTDRTPGVAQPVLKFSLAQEAAMNDTQITIRRDAGGGIVPGMMLTIGGRLHIIVALATADPVGPGGQPANGNVGVLIRPWLRADYAAGSTIELGSPFSTMRMASDDTGSMELQLSRYGNVTIDLIEAF